LNYVSDAYISIRKKFDKNVYVLNLEFRLKSNHNCEFS